MIDSFTALPQSTAAIVWSAERRDYRARRWLAGRIASLPALLQHKAATTYARIRRKSGEKAANLSLLALSDELSRHSLALHSDDSQIVALAERHAFRCARLRAAIPDASRALMRVTAYCESVGILPPVARRDVTTPDSLLARAACPVWWRRRLRASLARRAESALIRVGEVGVGSALYCSDVALSRRRQQRARNARTLSLLSLVRDDGLSFDLSEVVEGSVANPKVRRAELLTRIKGTEALAVRAGWVGLFWTITAPSRFHPRRDKSREPNPLWDGSSPRDAQAHLVKVWARARAALARADVSYCGLRVCEPHRDGTPHWHLLVFVPKEQTELATSTVREYALEDSPDEPGAASHRFTCVVIDQRRGSATGYVVKYLCKNVDGYGVESVGDDGPGELDGASGAERVDAWASTWGIRQFQFFGIAPVTVWRELRRGVSAGVQAVASVFAPALAAAEAGDWRSFQVEMGALGGRRRDWRLWLLKKENPDLETGEIVINRYGEPSAPRVIGVAAAFSQLITRVFTWAIQIKKSGSIAPSITSSQRANLPAIATG